MVVAVVDIYHCHHRKKSELPWDFWSAARDFCLVASDKIFAARETTVTVDDDESGPVCRVVDIYHCHHHIHHLLTITLSDSYKEKW